MQGLWWPKNAVCSLDYGMGYCFGRFIPYRKHDREPCEVVHHRDNVFICVQSLRLKLILICTLLSQPIFFERAAWHVSGLSGVLVSHIPGMLFSVFEFLGLYLARRGRRSATSISGGFCHTYVVLVNPTCCPGSAILLSCAWRINPTRVFGTRLWSRYEALIFRRCLGR